MTRENPTPVTIARGACAIASVCLFNSASRASRKQGSAKLNKNRVATVELEFLVRRRVLTRTDGTGGTTRGLCKRRARLSVHRMAGGKGGGRDPGLS